MAHVKKHEVTAKVASMSGAKPGERTKFMPNYQGGLSLVVNELAPEDRSSLQVLADEWNKAGLPDDLRRR